MKYIITGHMGLIGEHLKKELDKEHECVLKVDKRDRKFELKDLCCGNGIKTDIFFHLAAHCKINDGTMNPKLPHANNVDGTFECLEYCRLNNIKKFVFFSSSRVLCKEENPYTASKKYGETLCEAYRQCYGIEYLIIRPSTVYAECEDKTGRLITNWIKQAIKGEQLEIYGDENKTLDFTYVDDFNNGVKIILDNWNKTKNKAWNISGEEETLLVDLADMIGEELDIDISVRFTDPEIAQPQNVKININPLKKLGYLPKIKLREGVNRLCKYYE